MNKMYMNFFPWVRENEVRKKKRERERVPVVVVGGGLYRVRHPHYISGL